MADTKYWLFKSEPNAYSFSDLMSEEGQTAEWDGVRNYQARNFMKDDMKLGDRALFYHSSTGEPAVVGMATIVREGYPDNSSWDSNSRYYDPKSSPDNPIWFMVDIKGDAPLPREVTLKEVKANPKLGNMLLVRRGMRLSIQPVAKEEWDEILAMAGAS